MSVFVQVVQIWQTLELLDDTFWPFYVVNIGRPYDFNLLKLVLPTLMNANAIFQCCRYKSIWRHALRLVRLLLLPLPPPSKSPTQSCKRVNRAAVTADTYA